MNVVNEVVFYAALAVGSYLVPKLLLIVYNFVRVLVTVRKIPLAENWKPIVGHTAALASGVPWQLMKEWVLRDPAKPIVRIQVLARQCVVVYKAAHVKQLLHTHVKHYTKVPTIARTWELAATPAPLCLSGISLLTCDIPRRVGLGVFVHAISAHTGNGSCDQRGRAVEEAKAACHARVSCRNTG
eukprot:scaffold2804_cov371-Prasinococcus_capsulatus_cf.AAC.14